jgi:hypothetical protein
MTGTEPLLKTCRKCQIRKSRADFYAQGTLCKRCLIAKSAQYQKAHPRTKEQAARAHKKWYAKNREYKARYWKQWYQKNKEHRATTYAAWVRNNRHIVNAVIMKRTVMKRRAMPTWADQAAILAVYQHAVRLTTETGIKHVVDHIVPLQNSLVCGLHIAGNLQVLTAAANRQKSNHFVTTFSSFSSSSSAAA